MGKITQPADFMTDKFGELLQWLEDHEWTLLEPRRWRNLGDTMEVEVIERVIPGELIEPAVPEIDIPPQYANDSYEYHAKLTHFNDVLGDQVVIFDPFRIADFFFKYMTVRNNFMFTFKLAKELGKPTKGTVTVQMHDDTMVIEHLISHIKE